jgi:hypothetical protein
VTILPPQWGLFDKTFGRTDAQEADPEGRVPDWSKASVQEMKDRFVAVGLGPRQVTPLPPSQRSHFSSKDCKNCHPVPVSCLTDRSPFAACCDVSLPWT